MIDICTIIHNDEDRRLTISYDAETRRLYADGDEIDTPELDTIEAAENYCAAAWGVDPLNLWELEWIERGE